MERSSNGGQQKTTARPYMSHDLNQSPGPSIVREKQKHFPLRSTQPVENHFISTEISRQNVEGVSVQIYTYMAL